MAAARRYHSWADDEAPEGYRGRRCRRCPTRLRWQERGGARGGPLYEVSRDGLSWQLVADRTPRPSCSQDPAPEHNRLPGDERRELARAITRLVIKWHPDRNETLDPVAVCQELLGLRRQLEVA